MDLLVRALGSARVKRALMPRQQKVVDALRKMIESVEDNPDGGDVVGIVTLFVWEDHSNRDIEYTLSMGMSMPPTR